jgi:hypothetical protein
MGKQFLTQTSKKTASHYFGWDYQDVIYTPNTSNGSISLSLELKNILSFLSTLVLAFFSY